MSTRTRLEDLAVRAGLLVLEHLAPASASRVRAQLERDSLRWGRPLAVRAVFLWANRTSLVMCFVVAIMVTGLVGLGVSGSLGVLLVVAGSLVPAVLLPLVFLVGLADAASPSSVLSAVEFTSFKELELDVIRALPAGEARLLPRERSAPEPVVEATAFARDRRGALSQAVTELRAASADPEGFDVLLSGFDGTLGELETVLAELA